MQLFTSHILVVIQIESEAFLYLLFNEVIDYRIRLSGAGSLTNFNEACGMFRNPWNAKWLALLFLGLSCLGSRGVKNEKIQWSHIWILLSVGAVLFFMNWWMPALHWNYTYWYIIRRTCRRLLLAKQ